MPYKRLARRLPVRPRSVMKPASFLMGCLLAAAPASAQIVRVSVSTAGVEANRSSLSPSISADGRYIVFASDASNLVSGDTNLFTDIFLRDRDTDADAIFD